MPASCLCMIHPTSYRHSFPFRHVCQSPTNGWKTAKSLSREFSCAHCVKQAAVKLVFRRTLGNTECWWKLAHINLRQDTVEHCVWTPRLISTYSLTMNKPAALHRMTVSRTDGKTAMWAIPLLSSEYFLNIFACRLVFRTSNILPMFAIAKAQVRTYSLWKAFIVGQLYDKGNKMRYNNRVKWPLAINANSTCMFWSVIVIHEGLYTDLLSYSAVCLTSMQQKE